MRLDYADEGSPAAVRPARGHLALPLSLLMVGLSYLLFVSGPILAQRLAPLLGSQGSGASLPTPVALGIALVGAALLVFVLSRLVRDVDAHPYVSVAPVVAVFLGLVLSSARIGLPLAGITGEHLGLFALALPLLGGAMIARHESSVRLLGWTLAVLPVVAIVLALTSSGGHGDPVTMLRRVEPAVRTYLMILSASAFGLALLGIVARRMAAARPPQLSGVGPLPLQMSSPPPMQPSLRMPRPSNGPPQMAPHLGSMAPHAAPRRNSSVPPAGPGVPRRVSMPGAGPAQKRSTLLGNGPSQLPQRHTAAPSPRPAPQLQHFSNFGAAQPQSSLPYMSPLVSGIDEDEELLLLAGRKKARGLKVATAIFLGGAALVAAYFLVLQPAREKAATVVASADPAQPTPVKSAAEAAEVQAAELRLRELVSPGAAAANPAPAVAGSPGQPVVTSLPAPTAGAPTVTAMAKSDASSVAERPHRSRRSSRRSEAAPAARSAKAEKAEPASPVAERRSKTAALTESRAKPVSTKERAAAEKPQSSADMDLDQLVQKAMKGGSGKGGVSAANDPLLGL